MYRLMRIKFLSVICKIYIIVDTVFKNVLSNFISKNRKHFRSNRYPITPDGHSCPQSLRLCISLDVVDPRDVEEFRKQHDVVAIVKNSRKSRKLFPELPTTQFVQVYSPSHLKMRVWERGAGATLACGTGACAVVAAVLEGHSGRSCTVDLPVGPLVIEWREEDSHVLRISVSLIGVFVRVWRRKTATHE